MTNSDFKLWCRYVFTFSCLILFLNACEEAKKETDGLDGKSIQKHIVSYAKGFSIVYFDDFKVITLHSAWKGENKPIKYVLYKNEKPLSIDGIFIKTPIKSIACLSLTHIAFLEKLGLQNSIIGLSGCNYVSSPAIKKRIENKEINEVGQHEVVNYELLVNMNPEVIMAYGIDQTSTTKINKLKAMGLTTVLNAEYLENHPLGQAEWIKFIAAFYNEEDKADSIFNNIEQEYLKLLEITSKIKNKPTVFSGIPWNGAWYVPGGLSFQAQLFKDAGATYLWADNQEERSFVKSKEIILDEALNADFWLNVNAYHSIHEIIETDKVLQNFKALKQQQIYNNNLRENAAAGNDYWESGVINPHIVLKDLIKIFHPELVEHELYYYKKLE
ncbi:MAG: ABC transporter substrate-binding protein [Vicingaceae bacterium]|nr:ABC transporter substrate-binding protein [Vicingaceae bacterium]